MFFCVVSTAQELEGCILGDIDSYQLVPVAVKPTDACEVRQSGDIGDIAARALNPACSSCRVSGRERATRWNTDEAFDDRPKVWIREVFRCIDVLCEGTHG